MTNAMSEMTGEKNSDLKTIKAMSEVGLHNIWYQKWDSVTFGIRSGIP